jgi:hypothetical protein
MSRPVIREGINELKAPVKVGPGRVRRPGGGRKRVAERDPSVVSDLEKLVEPVTRGDPESPLRWTCKSVRRLAEELSRLGPALPPPSNRTLESIESTEPTRSAVPSGLPELAMYRKWRPSGRNSGARCMISPRL